MRLRAGRHIEGEEERLPERHRLGQLYTDATVARPEVVEADTTPLIGKAVGPAPVPGLTPPVLRPVQVGRVLLLLVRRRPPVLVRRPRPVAQTVLLVPLERPKVEDIAT